jgi:hypothetical protein
VGLNAKGELGVRFWVQAEVPVLPQGLQGSAQEAGKENRFSLAAGEIKSCTAGL